MACPLSSTVARHDLGVSGSHAMGSDRSKTETRDSFVSIDAALCSFDAISGPVEDTPQ